MHEVDTNGHVANQFDPGDPLVPRLPTQVDHHILNAFQNELVNAIEAGGITLVKGTNTQLRDLLGLNSGTRGAVARYFAAKIDILVGAAQALVLAGHPGSGDGLADIQNDVTGTRAKIASSTHAIDATGDIETNAEVKTGTLQFDITVHTTIPSLGPEGQVIYVAGAINMLYFSDGSAWVACG